MPAVGLDLALDLFAVGHAGGGKLGLDAEAALQLGTEHVHLDVALAGDDHLVRLGIVDEVKGNVLFIQAGKTGGNLVVLALGLRGDGHGVAGFGHLDGGKLVFLLRVADRITGLPVHLADGDDVAAAGVLDLGGLLAADGVETAELVGGGGTQVAQGHIGGDGALHDLQEAVLAELVGNGLEHEGLGRGGGVDALGLDGGGDIVHHALEEGLGADVLHGRAGKHGNHAAVLHAGADTGDHIGFIQLHGLKELLHQLFRGAGGSFHQLHAQVLDMAGIGSRNGTLGALGAVGDVADIVDQVDDALAVGGRDGDGSNDAAVLGAQSLDNRKVVAVLLIALGNNKGRGQICRLQVLPRALGSDGNAVLGRAQDHAGLHRAQRAQHLADKVEIARAVQHVDLAAAKGNRGQGRGNRNLALDLFRVIVADRVPVGNLAETVHRAGDKKHAFRQAGLAAVPMPEEGDVANVLTFHVLLPLCRKYE